LLTYAANRSRRSSVALWRLTVVFVMAAALVLNVMAGSYSGFMHAHEHDHAASDHHRDDHAANHAESQSDTKEASTKRDLADGGGSGSLDQTHEHPAEGVLSLPHLISCAYCDGRPSWSQSRPAKVAVYEFGPSERPPRTA
jgi:hypothetical protein